MPRKPTETTEQNAATRYTARWHRVDRWAWNALDLGDVTENDPPNPRISVRHGTWVDDPWNDEEAAERAVDLAVLALPASEAPSQKQTGVRRVAIRVHTWLVELDTRSVYSPQWITTGQGFSPHAAVLDHNRYVRAYANAVAHGIESRRLGVTAMEIVWWTARESARHV